MHPGKQKESILVVDDAADTLEMMQRHLQSKNYRVFTAPSVNEAMAILDDIEIDLVITDFKMPRVSGLDLVKHIRENFKETEVMMITGYASVEGAVQAIKSGAQEYLSKPFTSEELFAAVRRILDQLHLRKNLHPQMTNLSPEQYGLIGDSPVMQKIYRAIIKVAATSATVLITGESGTGKELVARAIHYNSSRASAPFVCVNCGSIPENLIESELFGHIKGAFTGASESRAGFFQTADGGTIFLDEIGDTSLSMQVKLLRVLQESEICMVGAKKAQNVDVKILAATNKDLYSLVKKDKFREDLFFRLNVLTIALPPLRDRANDILKFIPYFAAKFAKEIEKPVATFDDKALQVLQNYYWPGNVRELENVIQRIVVMCDDELIRVPDLPDYLRFSTLLQTDVNRTLAEIEAEHIDNVLASVNGNKSQAAKILGITRKTLREKIRRYKVDDYSE